MVASELILDGARRLLRVLVRGRVDREEGEELIGRARRLAAEHGYALLYDVREMELDVSLGDLFFLPRRLDVMREGSTRDVRVAIVFGVSDAERYGFYEDVAVNESLSVRVFTDEEAALEWLSHEQPPTPGIEHGA